MILDELDRAGACRVSLGEIEEPVSDTTARPIVVIGKCALTGAC